MTDKILIDRSVVEQGTTEQSSAVQPQVEKEPYIWISPENHWTWTPEAIVDRGDTEGLIPLYTHPQPKREPLTEKEISDLFQNQQAFPRLLKFIRVIEAAHGIGESNA